MIACVALIAAIGGTAYAPPRSTVRHQKDTVTGKQIKESTVKNVKSAKKAKTAKTVGGQSAEDLQVRWLLLNEKGVTEEQSGGFTVLDAYDTNANAYIDAGESLVGKGLTATIASQNQIDVGNPAVGNRNGETAVIRCQIPGVVECAPANAKIPSALVVTASNSSGTPAATPSPGTGAGTSSKRIYVTVTDSPDATTP